MDKCTFVNCALGGTLQHLFGVTCSIVLPRVNQLIGQPRLELLSCVTPLLQVIRILSKDILELLTWSPGQTTWIRTMNHGVNLS